MTEEECFLKIPNSVLYTDPSKLTWLEKVIISYRLSYGDNFYASNEHVAEKFFTTKKTVCVAYQRARDCDILPPEQMLMDTIITQSGSYGNVTNDYGIVTGSYGNVTNDYGKVTGSYGKVTDELLYRNQKEPISPMKNDLLLDQCIRTTNKNSSIKPVILPETESFIKTEPKLDGNIQVILQGSKLSSYHRTQEFYKHNLKPNYVYGYSKGWYLGLSQSDYDKLSKQNN